MHERPEYRQNPSAPLKCLLRYAQAGQVVLTTGLGFSLSSSVGVSVFTATRLSGLPTLYWYARMAATEWVIGIDEVGRGPLAGPIAVGATAIPVEYEGWEHWVMLKDSKKLSEKKRLEWDVRIRGGEVPCTIRYAVAMVHATTIDEKGIQFAARKAAHEALQKLALSSHDAQVFLDKGLSVSGEWRQEQFVKGDERFPVIALASIVAKVARDAYMKDLAPQYPQYSFDVHKGYGTATHREAIKKHGLVPQIHRASFCRRLTGLE